jgi:hypothetical protein
MEYILKDQVHVATKFDALHKTQMIKVCDAKYVVGMTFNITAANIDIVNCLAPYVVIVDEVSNVLELLLMPALLKHKVQHVVMLGNCSKPYLTNKELCGDIRSLDASIIEQFGCQYQVVMLRGQHGVTPT